jgi:hypothetical protein
VTGTVTAFWRELRGSGSFMDTGPRGAMGSLAYGRSRKNSTGDPSSFLDDGPTSNLIRQILGAVSEFDKAMTVAKLKGARDRVRRGSGPGRPTLSGKGGKS